MEYEMFEPDPQDEYYDQMISAAYAAMFNGGMYAKSISEHPIPDFCDASGN